MPNAQNYESELSEMINKNNLDTYAENLLRQLVSDNPRLLKLIVPSFLNKKYFDTLGVYAYKVIATSQEIQRYLIDLDDKKYTIMCQCMKNYTSKHDVDDFRDVINTFLDVFRSHEYDELFDNIALEHIDYDRLILVIQRKNKYGIKTMADCDNYKDVLKRENDRAIASPDSKIEDIQNALLLKMYGLDYKNALNIVKEFGKDINNLDNCPEKLFVLSIIEILSTEDREVLIYNYNNCDGVDLIDIFEVTKALKSQYAKMYNRTLYIPDEKKEISTNDLGISEPTSAKFYDAGTDFSMIIHAADSYDYRSDSISNYKAHWNRPVGEVEHLCTSYIRNNMLGTSGIRNICYGFSYMDPASLAESSYHDTYTASAGTPSGRSDLKLLGRECEFYTPNTQITKTFSYNEMDYMLIQNGKKIQPSYIVAFKKNGSIENLENILKASKDWGDELPIVVVDVDACLLSEKDKLMAMYQKYHNGDKSPEIARQIYESIRTNRVTDSNFMQDVFTHKEIEELIEFSNRKFLDKKDIEEIVMLMNEYNNGHFGILVDLAQYTQDKKLLKELESFYGKIFQEEENYDDAYERVNRFYLKIKTEIEYLIPDSLKDYYKKMLESLFAEESEKGNKR